jgi:hypothetical protein
VAGDEEREFLAAVNQRLYDDGSQRSITLTGQYPRTTLTLNPSDGTTDHDFGRFRIWEDLTPTGAALGIESWVFTITSQTVRPSRYIGRAELAQLSLTPVRNDAEARLWGLAVNLDERDRPVEGLA